jgi:hypothetical protein
LVVAVAVVLESAAELAESVAAELAAFWLIMEFLAQLIPLEAVAEFLVVLM